MPEGSRPPTTDAVELWIRASDHLTSLYIQTSLDWETYQLALAALRSALSVPLKQEEKQRRT